MNSEIEIVSETKRVRPEASEVERLFGDNSLIKEITNWVPKYNGLDGFKKGLKKTDWFSSGNKINKYKTNRYEI